MLEYTLETNELTKEPKKYRALVKNSKSYTFEDIANYLIRHNTGLSSAVIYGMWAGIKGAVKEFLSDGGSINTELFKASTSVKGTFNGLDDGFDKSRHQIRLNMRPGPLLMDIPGKLATKKIYPGLKTVIHSVTDVMSGKVNGNLTPGKSLKISGQRLKIYGADPSCGLYFVSNKANEAPVKIAGAELAVNKPSEIVTVVPKLKKGIWRLKVITQFSRGQTPLKEPQSVTFEKDLVVA